jgi:hypothetical protein
MSFADAVARFFSPAAGQARTRALNEAITPFIPPELRAHLGLADALNPVSAIRDAGSSARLVADPSLSPPERISALGDTTTNTVAALIPAFGGAFAARIGQAAPSSAVAETLTGFSHGSPPLARSAATETGAAMSRRGFLQGGAAALGATAIAAPPGSVRSVLSDLAAPAARSTRALDLGALVKSARTHQKDVDYLDILDDRFIDANGNFARDLALSDELTARQTEKTLSSLYDFLDRVESSTDALGRADFSSLPADDLQTLSYTLDGLIEGQQFSPEKLDAITRIAEGARRVLDERANRTGGGFGLRP